MDLHALTAFVEVAKQRSFSKAAKALFVTQPAISKRIGRLETELNVRLFDRIGKSVSLTEAGSVLLKPAHTILAERKNIMSLMSSLSDTVGGTLVMATSHHIGLHRLSPILRTFKEAYPEVNLDIRFMDSEKACSLVEKGELELAVVTLPEDPVPVLHAEVVWKDDMCFVGTPQHPLVQHQKVSIEDLAQYPAVLPAQGTYTRSILEATLPQVQLNVGMSTNYLETLKMLTATGIGWSLIPRVMLDDTVQEIRIPLKISRDLGVVTHRQKTLSSAAKMMLEMIFDYE